MWILRSSKEHPVPSEKEAIGFGFSWLHISPAVMSSVIMGALWVTQKTQGFADRPAA